MYGLESEYPWYLTRLGRIYIEQGKLAEARMVLHEAQTQSANHESMLNPGIPQAQLGEVALMQGQLDEARWALRQALLHLGPENEIFLAMATTDLAEVALESGEFREAREWLAQSLEYSNHHNRRFIIFLCSLAGYLALSSNNTTDTAVRCYGAILALSDRLGLPLSAYYQRVNQNRMQIARQVLTEDAWRGAFEAGKGWDKEEIIRMATRILFNK